MKKLLLFAPLLITMTILLIGSVRGWTVAKTQPEKFPCAFEKKSGNTWRGGLSLDDARRIERKAARLGERAVVRFDEVSWAEVRGTIRCVSKAYRMDPAPFIAVATCESGMNPANDTNPMYDGLYQYLPATWRASAATYGHAGASAYDGYAAIHTTVQKVREEGWEAWGSCI